MNAAMRILALSGSLRSTSSTAALVRAAAAAPGVTLESFEAIGELPHFSPDLDVDPLPPAVARLRARIGASDAMLIATPEYAHGMPGSLKNALDWLVSAFEPIHKPVLLISGSPAGAQHAHAQLSEVLRTMSMRLVDGGAHVFSRAHVSPAGEVTSEPVRAALAAALAQLEALAAQPAG
jgi:NAD(P)H-dependent FMN reductase